MKYILPDPLKVGGNTGGDGAGAPTIHSAITLRPSQTGKVIAIKLAITRETHTQNKRPISLAGNQRGLTYGWKTVDPSLGSKA